MAFHEVQFPPQIAYGSSGGPVRRTDIIELDSGFEQRNQPWSQSRHKFNVAYGVKTYDLLYMLKAFWEARGGQLYGFRFKDWSDYKSVRPDQNISPTDQVIGVGNGVNKTFQLTKTYNSDIYNYTRTILKPVTGTTVVSLNDVQQTSGWSINTTTGVITFTTAPANTVVVKAGFEFDVPVRFEAASLTINLEAFKNGTLDDINLIELRSGT